MCVSWMCECSVHECGGSSVISTRPSQQFKAARLDEARLCRHAVPMCLQATARHHGHLLQIGALHKCGHRQHYPQRHQQVQHCGDRTEFLNMASAAAPCAASRPCPQLCWHRQVSAVPMLVCSAFRCKDHEFLMLRLLLLVVLLLCAASIRIMPRKTPAAQNRCGKITGLELKEKKGLFSASS